MLSHTPWASGGWQGLAQEVSSRPNTRSRNPSELRLSFIQRLDDHFHYILVALLLCLNHIPASDRHHPNLRTAKSREGTGLHNGAKGRNRAGLPKPQSLQKRHLGPGPLDPRGVGLCVRDTTPDAVQDSRVLRRNEMHWASMRWWDFKSLSF